MTIPIGKLDSKAQWNINSYEIAKAEKLSVKNKVKGATYTFKSSNTKVVTISKNGGYLTGIKAGTATITCTQNYKNKKTTVGKCNVTVKKAAMIVDEYAETEFAIGSNGFDLVSYYACMDQLFHIEYRNPKATYSLTSDSKNFTIKEIKYDAKSIEDIPNISEDYKEVLENYIGDRYFYGYEFTAKKAGTYKVTVKETYNKKTTSLGSFKVVIKEPSLAYTDVDMLLGDSIYLYYLVQFQKSDKSYYYIIEDYDETVENNPVFIYDNEGDYLLYGNKVGNAKITVREGSEDGTLIGTINVKVSDAPCEEIILDQKEYTVDVGEIFYGIYFSLEPGNTTDTVTVTSDNPEVLDVKYSEEYGDWAYKVGKVGKATVTIKCGEQSVDCVVTVVEDKDVEDDWDDDWDEDWD